MKRIVFAHNNFPAQFGTFGTWLAERDWQVVFITQNKEAQHPTIKVFRCEDHREASPNTHRYLHSNEKVVITGQAFARTASHIASQGFTPDIIMAHSGRGASAFLNDVWPQAHFIPYFEWYYRWPYVDRTPEHAPEGNPIDERAKNRIRNAPFWTDFSSASASLCPTQFQAAQFPEPLRERLTVMHDGIDTDLHSPGDGNRAILSRWNIPPDAEVLTSITRGMEPHRGFPETMRALAMLQKRRPKLHALVGGEDRVAYGAKLPEGESWKKRMLAELDLDLSRIHFTGLLTRRDMIDVMRASDVHTYLTVPFVLSWSLLDSMSTGCLIVASDTEPVREFMTDNQTGLLCPMYHHDALAARIEYALDNAETLRPIRRAARALVVENLDAARVIYPKKLLWLKELSERPLA